MWNEWEGRQITWKIFFAWAYFNTSLVNMTKNFKLCILLITPLTDCHFCWSLEMHSYSIVNNKNRNNRIGSKLWPCFFHRTLNSKIIKEKNIVIVNVAKQPQAPQTLINSQPQRISCNIHKMINSYYIESLTIYIYIYRRTEILSQFVLDQSPLNYKNNFVYQCLNLNFIC